MEKIVSSFVINESYVPTYHHDFTGFPFTKFQPISEKKLMKIILSGNFKYCYLDPIPTSVLKQVLEHILPNIN